MGEASEDRSQNFLVSCEDVLFSSGVFRLHRCFFKFAVLREEMYPSGDFKRVEMQNWSALLGLEQGVKVRHTTMSWIVHVEVIRGRTPVEVTNLALNLAGRVRNALCSKYGCVLGEGKIVAGEMAHEDPVASLFGRFFTVRTDNRKIDHSWGPGELEHTQRDAVIEYLQMPEKVKNIEVEVAALRSDIGLLTSTLRQLFDAEGTGNSSSPKKVGGKDSYVT